MNIQRLKFAWARGARIQVFFNDDPYWWDDSHPTFQGKNHKYRIHPDDVHLEYGPLSKAMRERPQFHECDRVGLVAFAVALELFSEGNTYSGSAEEWGMFYLFAAELLADEGL